MSNTQIITKVLMALLFASLYSCDSEKNGFADCLKNLNTRK